MKKIMRTIIITAGMASAVFGFAVELNIVGDDMLALPAAQLDARDFADPPLENRPAMLWFWKDTQMTPALIDEQLDLIKGIGIYRVRGYGVWFDNLNPESGARFTDAVYGSLKRNFGWALGRVLEGILDDEPLVASSRGEVPWSPGIQNILRQEGQGTDHGNQWPQSMRPRIAISA